MSDELHNDENPMEHAEEMERLKAETEASLNDKNLESVEESLEESSEDVVDKMDELSSNVAENIIGAGEAGVEKITETTGNLFSGLKDTGSSLVEGAQEQLGNLAEGGSEILDSAKDMGSSLVESASDTVGNISKSAQEQLGHLAEGGSEILDSAKDLGSNLVEGAGDTVGKLSEGAQDLASGASQTVNEAAANIGKTGNAIVAAAVVGAGAVGFGNKIKTEKAESSLVDNDIPSVLRPKDIFKDEEVEEIPDPLLEKANIQIGEILNRLKEKNYGNDYGILGYLLPIPIILAALWQFIDMGLTIRLGVLVLLGIFFLVYRASIKGISRTVLEQKSTLQKHQGNSKNDILAKINYVLSGIDLNLKRIGYIKWLFVLFTPFLWHAGAEIWKGSYSASNTFWMIFIGFVISLIVWPLVFKRDTSDLNQLEDELLDIRRDFIS